MNLIYYIIVKKRNVLRGSLLIKNSTTLDPMENACFGVNIVDGQLTSLGQFYKLHNSLFSKLCI